MAAEIICAVCGYANPREADFCLNPSVPGRSESCGEYLGWAKREAAGPEPAGTPTPPAPEAPPDPRAAGRPGRVEVAASLTPTHLSVEPGGETTCEIRVRNLGSVVDQFQLEVQGAPWPWSLMEPAALSLFPDTESTALLRFRPPRSPGVPAGPARFRVRVVSSTAPDVFTLVEGLVDVRPYAAVGARIMPQHSGGPERADHRLVIDNQGNAQIRVLLEASDPDGVLDLRVESPVLTVEPGASAVTSLAVVARRPITAGPAQPRPFDVQIEVPDGPALRLPAVFVQEPLPARPAMHPPVPPPAPPDVPATQAGFTQAPGPSQRRGLGAGGCLVLALLVPLLLLGGLIFGLLAYTLFTEGDSNYNATYLGWTAGFLVFTLLVLMAIRWVWRRSRSG